MDSSSTIPVDDRYMKWLQVSVASARAVLEALTGLVAGRGEWHPVVLRIGDIAPDFELPGSDGRAYRLSDSRGREPVVIAWFPRAFTGGCTMECRSLAASREPLRQTGVQYFAASVDTPEENRKFARSLDLEYPVLSDPGRSVARAFGVLGPTGFASRWTFYIGLDGRIVDIDRDVHPASHGRDVVARLTSQAGPPGQAGA